MAEEIPQSGQTGNERGFTLKSVLFGLLGIFIVSGLAGFHDSRMPGTLLVGTHLPVGAFFYILLVGLGWNLACSRLLPGLVLNSKELVVVMGMTLMACFPPTSSLCRYFQRQLLLPWYYLSSGGQTEWEKFGILDYLPKKLFPTPPPEVRDGILQLDDTVYRGFFTGLAKGKESVSLFALPWGGWIQPLMYWGPLIVLMSVCVLSLTLLVHRQWSEHEQLSYPVAQVAGAFVKREKGRGIPDLFRSKLFWWGFSPVFLLYMLEYLHQWFPIYVPGLLDTLPNLKSTGWLPLYEKFPLMMKAPGWWGVCIHTTFFSVIGLSYFVSTEISLTMGLAPILMCVAGAWYFMITGTPVPDTEFTGVPVSRCGAYFGYALILIYTGRTYYSAILKKALFIGKASESDRIGIMAARLTVLSFAAFVGVLVIMGLDWLVALTFSLFLMLLFLVLTRIICETGVPFIQANWFPGSILVPLFGPAAVGPGPLVFVVWLGTILVQDPRECLMPYAATSIKMADDAKLHVGKIFWILVGAVIVALAVAFTATTWTQYNFGGMAVDNWASQGAPRVFFDNAARYVSEMSDTGTLDQSAKLHGLAKTRLYSPDPQALGFFAFGMIAVIVFSMIRFRFSRFPLHPALFIVWGTYPSVVIWGSFLIGWAIKSLVVRFGGGRVYQNLKPVFMGLIAGELMAAGTAIFVDMIYYYVTGGKVPSFGFNVLAT